MGYWKLWKGHIELWLDIGPNMAIFFIDSIYKVCIIFVPTLKIILLLSYFVGDKAKSVTATCRNNWCF